MTDVTRDDPRPTVPPDPGDEPADGPAVAASAGGDGGSRDGGGRRDVTEAAVDDVDPPVGAAADHPADGDGAMAPEGAARSTTAKAPPDELATLEEERRFLRSLADLEREHEAGDVDDVDYQTLKDGYTARAATVIKAVEAGRRALPPRRRPRRGRIATWAALVAVVAVGAGLLVAHLAGQRLPGQAITGSVAQDTNSELASAGARCSARIPTSRSSSTPRSSRSTPTTSKLAPTPVGCWPSTPTPTGTGGS